MRKVSSYKCPECGMRYKSLGAWGEHLERIHPGSLPEGYSYARYFYFCTTGKTAGSCVQCHRPTEWNEATGKYSRYCSDPKCKQEYVKTAKKRMVDKYGKAHLLNDPNKQREMLDSRSQSYKFRDGGTVRYLSSYEKDFLMTAEYTLGLKSKDIIGPSPNTYVYIYEGKEHFYIPDFYIPDLNLEIEIKESDNTHPHMQVDRAKEKLKDEMMIKNPAVNYFKIIDKKYTDFYKFILDCKLAIDDTTRDKLSQLLVATEGAIDFAFEGITSYRGLTTPEDILNYVRKNVSYAEFSKLQSPQETLKKKKGSCHDQVLLSFMLLEELKIKPTIHFFISYKEGEETGGDTHTFITYEDNGEVCWFETAWGDMEGIHKYPNMKALKEDIKAHHDKTPMGKKYPELEFATVSRSKFEYEMSLDELVQVCLGSEASESVKCDIPVIIPKQMFKRDFLNIPDSSLLHLTRDEYIKRCSKDPNFGKDSEFYGFYNEYDEIMGITCVTDMGSSKCIDLIVVDDKYRRRGLGTYITNFACKQLHGDWLIVRDSNKAALSIYKKYGFKETTRYEGRVFMTAPNSSKKIDFGKYIEEHYSPAVEQAHYDILVDKLDPNHKQKGKKSLSQFKRQPLTKELVKKFKGQGKLITDGFRYQDPKHPEDTCVVWTDDDKYVGAIAYDTYPDKQGYKWITALDVGYDYKSYGLGEQIVKYAMSKGANALAVQYDNEIALRLYKKLGFKTSKISEEDVKAGRNASYNLYLDPSHAVESALKASERTDFGLPDIKKYPMPDEKHVLLAIQYFNYVEEDRERELADNILKRMSELNIKCVNVGEKNRFAKYYKPTEDSVMTSWCASEPGMGIVAMESGHGDDFYTPIRLNTKQWCNYKGQKYYPLYIVLLKNMDALGRVIQTYTKEPYSHSLISFDPSMNDLYTFGHKLMKKGDKEHMDFGTAHETFNPKTGRFHYPLNTQYEIFVMFFNEKQIKAVRKTIDDIFTNHEKYKYNIAGLIQYIFKIPRTNPQKLFCSQFVSMVLNSGKPDLLDRDPSMYTPSNLMTLRGIFSVDSGVMKDYDATLVEKKTKQIFDRIVDSGDTTALEHTNLLYNVDWENSDSIEVYGGYTYPES